jgi:hypothetical protein
MGLDVYAPKRAIESYIYTHSWIIYFKNVFITTKFTLLATKYFKIKARLR